MVTAFIDITKMLIPTFSDLNSTIINLTQFAIVMHTGDFKHIVSVTVKSYFWKTTMLSEFSFAQTIKSSTILKSLGESPLQENLSRNCKV